jgi:hypothetical protein
MTLASVSPDAKPATGTIFSFTTYRGVQKAIPLTIPIRYLNETLPWYVEVI